LAAEHDQDSDPINEMSPGELKKRIACKFFNLLLRGSSVRKHDINSNTRMCEAKMCIVQ